jgi:hypothetical protein
VTGPDAAILIKLALAVGLVVWTWRSAQRMGRMAAEAKRAEAEGRPPEA